MRPEKPPATRSRNIRLDALRGLAILLVLGHHHVLDPMLAGTLAPLAGAWRRFGWTGVDLFFVLSGFLIGGLLFDEIKARGRIDIRRFLIRRAFKIWPSYYVFLAASAILALGTTSWPTPLRTWEVLCEFYPLVLNVQNYLWPSDLRLHLWSLAVEEHFYLALPLLLGLLLAINALARGRRKPDADPVRAVAWLAGLMIVACTAARFDAVAKPYREFSLRFYTHFRVDSLAFGVLVAYLRVFRPDTWDWLRVRSPALLAIGLALISPMIVYTPDRYSAVLSIGFVALYLGYAAIVVAASGPGPSRPSWLTRGLALAGVYSYPTYLWHMEVLSRLGARPIPALRASLRQDEVYWLAATSLLILASIGWGCLMAWLVERPALAVRDRFFPSRVGPALARPVGASIANQDGGGQAAMKT